MPIYKEKKKVNGKTQYYIRAYLHYDNGTVKQTTRHNKNWIGKDGYWLAHAEEKKLCETIFLTNSSSTDNKIITTINELKDAFIQFKKNKVDDDTIYVFERNVNKHFISTEGNKLVSEYTDVDYKYWQDKMKSKKYYKGKVEHCYSLKFLNELHRNICEMFSYIVENEKYIKDAHGIEKKIEKNVIKSIGKFGTKKERVLEKHKKKWNIISYNSYLKLMGFTKNDMKYNTMFDLFYSNGPRPGELMAFRWCDYSYENESLMVEYTLSKKGNRKKRVLKDPKTVASKAMLSLDHSLNKKLKRWKEHCMKNPNFSENWFIFGKENPISENAINNAIKKYIKDTNLSIEFRPHDFRHSFASWLFSLKLPLPYISTKMRHASISETIKTYAHLIPDDYYDCNQTLNNIKEKQLSIDNTRPKTRPKAIIV